MNKRGLVSISFRALSPEEILKEMTACGLTHIEWGSDVHAPQNDLEKVKAVAALQAQYGVTCSSYGTYFKIGTHENAEFENYIIAAKTLGTDVLRLWCGNKNGQDYTEDEKNALFSKCKELAAMAEKHGVTLCMECHNNTFTNKKETALELMQAVDSQHFKMYWQPNQLETVEENLAYAGLIAPYTVNIHVFNWKGNEKFPLADGVDIWKKYLACFNGSQPLLLEFMPDGKLETLKVEAAALEEICG